MRVDREREEFSLSKDELNGIRKLKAKIIRIKIPIDSLHLMSIANWIKSGYLLSLVPENDSTFHIICYHKDFPNN